MTGLPFARSRYDGAVLAVRFPLLAAFLVFGGNAAAANAVQTITTPAPVSGRSLARPESITAADALARLILVRDNLELLRAYMGRYPAPAPLIRATQASVSEAYYAGINLRRRLSRLAFEQLRVDVEWRILPPGGVIRPFEVFGLMDGALVHVLRVKRSLGIDRSVPERLQPEDTTPTDLFNAMTETGGLVNVLLDKKTEARDAFLGATVVAHIAAELHVAFTNRLMPDEPDFVPGKTPPEVLTEIRACFELVARLARSFEVEPLLFTIAEPTDLRRVSPDDVLDLFVLMIAELDRITAKAALQRKERNLVPPGRRYPSHVYQRARFIKALLGDVVASREQKRR